MKQLFLRLQQLRPYYGMAAFSLGYLSLFTYAMNSKSELLRFGVAGSITGFTVESFFYHVDAVNFKSKVKSENVSYPVMAKQVYRNEGIRGFFQGYSASFYGSFLYGFTYFYIYKATKNMFLGYCQERQISLSTTFIYAIASTIAEIFALAIYYPFLLVKVRILTKNDIYQYKSVLDGFKKIINEGSIINLYRGTSLYFLTYIIAYTVQMVTYEKSIEYLKNANYGDNKKILISSIFAGFLTGLVTNFLECIVVQKQVGNKDNIQFLKKEWRKLLTKGIAAKLTLSIGYSIIIFWSLNQYSRLLNTSLED